MSIVSLVAIENRRQHQLFCLQENEREKEKQLLTANDAGHDAIVLVFCFVSDNSVRLNARRMNARQPVI